MTDGELDADRWVPKLDGPDIGHALLRRQVESELFGELRPVKIGRFEIERLLGRGGMGEVYLGRDVKLRRPVAVKLLRAQLYERSSRVGHERARREAQALAQVSHPNVIEVFEVGEHEGRTFVAMEYVEGRTLREWVDAANADWRELVRVYIEAGRGLLAAHRAGLVHRDFKPDNVLISGEGRELRVRVLDFGLARLVDVDDSGGLESTLEHGDSELTAAGTVLGTLSYMSPEQLRGEVADAASDQFSFCVALYRALWRRDPFFGDSVHQRLACMGARAPEAPPTRRGPERRLWAIVRRGLARTPSERWPSMAELLDALEQTARGRRVGPLLGLAGLALAAGLAIGVTWDISSAGDPCDHVERRGASLWTDGRDALARARFEASGEAYAMASFETVDASLRQWSASWTEQRALVCQAGEAGPRVACLDRALSEASLLAQALVEADAQTIAEAVDSLQALPSLRACDASEDLLGLEPIPAGIEAELADLRARLAHGRVLRLTGHLREADAVFVSLDADAAGLGYRPFAAELALERALLSLDQTSTSDMSEPLAALRAAAKLAESCHHDRLAAVAWTVLARRGADVGGATDAQVEGWLERAEISVTRLGAPVELAARLHCTRGALLGRQGREQGARASLERGLELFATLDPHDIHKSWRPSCMMDLARLSSDAAAVELGERALDEIEARFGASHPKSANLRFELARLFLELPGTHERSVELLEQLADQWTNNASSGSAIEAAYGHLSLAAAAHERGDLDLARRHAVAARELYARALPEDDYQHAMPVLIEAQIDFDVGEHQRALDSYDRARALVVGEPGLDAYVAQIDRDRGLCLIELERLDEAEGLMLALRPPGRDDPELELALARIELRRGRLDRARALVPDGPLRRTIDVLDQLRAGDPVDCEAVAIELDASIEDLLRDSKASETERRCLVRAE